MSHEYFDSMQPFDGSQPSISERERDLVASKFSAFVDDMLLGHIEDIRNSSFMSETSLLMTLPVSGDESITVSVRKRDLSDGRPSVTKNGHIVDEISLQHKAAGYGRDYVAYRLFEDGVVRRWNGGDIYAKMQEEKALGIEPKFLSGRETKEEIRDTIFAGLEDLTQNIIPNRQLEQDMGLQNQPVGLGEIDSLIDLLDTPGLRSYKLF